MFSLCRLCANYTEPTELTIEISDLEQKLVLCCGWQPSKNVFQMVNKVCNLCVNQVQRSWDLVEQIREAETRLNKLLNEQTQSNANQNDVAYKIENDMDFGVDGNNYIDTGGGGVDDDNGSDIGDRGDDVFGESINYFIDENSQSEQSKNVEKPERRAKNKSQMKDDSFFATLDPEHLLENGQISLKGITKLTKLYPDMNTMSWNECQYKCSKCDQTLKGSNNLYSHMRSMHMDEPMSIKLLCCYCDFKHRREHTLNRHISSEHFEHLKFRCAYCSQYYWNTIELTNHRNSHTDIEYKCEKCEQIFHNRDTMYSHCSSHHSKKGQNKVEEEYICDLCSKRFKTKAGVRSHLFLHMKKFNYVCDQCGWKFASKGNLKGHLASTHATERPFKCNQCYKRFKTKHQMNNHAVIHNNVYKHECTVCGRKFRRPYTLGVHMRSHTHVCPYQCRYCGKSFRHNITLQTHERTHTNDKPYGCTHCEYRTTSKGNLNKHMMRAHSIDFRNHIVQQNN